jgi:hypothetical protein
MMLDNPILPGLHTLHLMAISTHTYYTSVGRSHLMVEECVSGSENASKGTTGLVSGLERLYWNQKELPSG